MIDPTPERVTLPAPHHHQLVDSVARFCAHHQLISPQSTVVVGVSGGYDSVTLLHVLLRLAQKTFPGLRLHVTHLDHGLRGPEGAADAAAVAELAAAWGVPHTVERADVARHRAIHGLSVEQAARVVRYRFFARVATEVGADSVAVAHTADDQVETILLHVLRGAGSTGLRGMLPSAAMPEIGASTAVRLIRPLLETGRADIVAYAAKHALPVRNDPTNQSPAFRRNRVRHELLPVLETYNPNVREALLRLAQHAGDDETVVMAEVNRVWPRLAEVGDQRVVLDLEVLSSLLPAVRRHVLRRALHALLGDIQGIAQVHIEAIFEALEKPAGTRLDLPRGVHFEREYRHAVLSVGRTRNCSHPLRLDPTTVSVPGSTVIPGWTIRTRMEATVGQTAQPASGNDPWCAHLDAGTVGEPLRIRSRLPGDRFQPLGMTGSKKLQDFLVDVRVPRACRDHVPLLTAGDAILWVVGWRIDHRHRVTAGTRRTLVVECRPDDRLAWAPPGTI